MIVAAKFPKKLRFLFEPSRYKVARGGRSSAKSWSFARALLLMGTSKRLRILCAREVQLSIKQSVHKLLKDQIQKLKLDSQYAVLETEIRGKNGTEFAFTGLSTLTVETIKSFEGYDVVWVEEGQTISKRSWDILIPTIRKDGSEIWISYNPDLETDETHQRFTVDPPPDCMNVEVNWRDNPWFNDVMEQERLYCMGHNPDDYDNIWEGKCKPAVEGAIYFKQILEAETQGRICNVPYDPMLKVHVIMDLGWEDSLATGLVQKSVSEVRLIEYLEANHTSLDLFSAELRQRRYNWGSLILPHDGFSKQLNAKGKSTQDILKAMGWKVPDREKIVELSIDEGIRTTRMVFPRIYFDKTKCAALQSPEPSGVFYHTERSHRLLECIKRYRRHINKTTDAAGKPVKDPNAHGCLHGDSLIKTPKGDIAIKNISTGDSVWTPAGVARVLWSGATKRANSLIEITLSNGRKIKCTREHKILTKKGFICVDDLRFNDSVFSGEELPCKISALFSMVTGFGYRETITEKADGNRRGRVIYTGRFGNIIMGKFQKVMKFTIKTLTHSIIPFQTLSFNYCTSISQNTPEIDAKQAVSTRQINRPLNALPNGTDRKMAVLGIQRMPRKSGGTKNFMSVYVKNAANALCLLSLRVLSFAIPTVKQLRYVKEEAGTLVYDLTVENHACYQANEILVSNSDMLRYLAINIDKLTNEDDVRPTYMPEISYQPIDADIGM